MLCFCFLRDRQTAKNLKNVLDAGRFDGTDPYHSLQSQHSLRRTVPITGCREPEKSIRVQKKVLLRQSGKEGGGSLGKHLRKPEIIAVCTYTHRMVVVTVIFQILARAGCFLWPGCRGVGYACFCAVIAFPDTLDRHTGKIMVRYAVYGIPAGVAFSYSKARILFGDARKEETASEEKEGSREHSAWLRATGNGFPCFML